MSYRARGCAYQGAPDRPEGLLLMSNAESGLTPSELGELEARLRDKRAELESLLGSLSQITGTKRDCAILDMADSASLAEMQQRARSLTEQHTETIREIEAALRRLESGRYGLSEVSGEPIGYQRLRIIPWARTAAVDG